MEVFPVFNNKIGAVPTAFIKGRVERGNDAGKLVSEAKGPYPPAGPYGEFTFTWNIGDVDVQSSTIEAQVKVNGEDFNCPSTVLHFNPHTYKVEPSVPGSPF